MKNDEEALHHVSPKSLIVVFATAGVTIFGSILGIASMLSGNKCCLGVVSDISIYTAIQLVFLTDLS